MFLKSEDDDWPVNPHLELSKKIIKLEKRKTAVGLAATVIKLDLLDVMEEFSSHFELLREFVYMFRFIATHVQC